MLMQSDVYVIGMMIILAILSIQWKRSHQTFLISLDSHTCHDHKLIDFSISLWARFNNYHGGEMRSV